MSTSKKRSANNRGTEEQKVAHILTTQIFSPEALSKKRLSAGVIAKKLKSIKLDKKTDTFEVVPMARTTVYEWIRFMHLDAKSQADGIEPMSQKQRAEFLLMTLSYQQARILYDWGRKERFADKPDTAKRPKTPSKRELKARTKKERAKQTAKADSLDALNQLGLTSKAKSNPHHVVRDQI